MTTSDIDLVHRAWDAFSRGDVAAAAAVLDPDVHWYGAGEPDGLTAELLDLRDGKVVEMVVDPTVEDALAAAGLAANT